MGKALDEIPSVLKYANYPAYLLARGFQKLGKYYIGGSSSGGSSASGSLNNVINKNGNDNEMLEVKDEGVHNYEDQRMERRRMSMKRARFEYVNPTKYEIERDEL